MARFLIDVRFRSGLEYVKSLLGELFDPNIECECGCGIDWERFTVKNPVLRTRLSEVLHIQELDKVEFCICTT